MGKGEVNTKPNAVKKTKGLKPMPAVMKARESGERKDLLRNRIELKRLQTLVDRLRNELEGVEDERKKVEAPIGKITLELIECLTNVLTCFC